MGRDGRVDELVTGGESVTCCLFLNFQIFKFLKRLMNIVYCLGRLNVLVISTPEP